MRRSLTLTQWRFPPFPRNSKQSCEPWTVTCRLRSVVSPKEPFCRAYCLVANPDGGALEQSDHRREHRLPSQAPPGKVGPHARANAGQRPGELDEPSVLRLVPDGAPPGMVTVLLAPPAVAPNGLQVSLRRRTDPDCLPGGRDRQRADPTKCREVADRRSIGAHVAESPTRAEAADAGLGSVT